MGLIRHVIKILIMSSLAMILLIILLFHHVWVVSLFILRFINLNWLYFEIYLEAEAITLWDIRLNLQSIAIEGDSQVLINFTKFSMFIEKPIWSQTC